jgi:hypothetical protein
MRTFELRVYRLRTKEALDFYKEQIYPCHLSSFPLFGIEAQGFWTAKEDVEPRFFVLASYAISAIADAGTRRTSPYSFLVVHHMHGPGSRVAPDATAFCMRRNHFMMEIGAAWEPNSNGEAARHRQWATDLSSALAPFALPGGYANFLTSNDHEQIESAYGKNVHRLRELKQQFDSDNVFSSTIPLA